ncbi:multifunctional CCA addition/repair protein [Wenzhouxiangella sp. XN79A]|nr:multifunctional CCA addition/repair protein [Wenzhouxiangella sp. XN79A]NKI35282.1 multifunctional CCA addition/repair protein [Wenzhouxiangella sp. XN79A]
MDGLEVYRVGGAIRDELLGLPVADSDFVVVGSSPEQLAGRGFRPVGRDFPVFLHPERGDEFALARTERKSGSGYAGFAFHTGPDVTLTDDLRRRDLTINAIAEDRSGRLIDPFDGRRDLERRTLRHVSPAFVEDPVRLLRLARFATRFAAFDIAEETSALARRLVASGEVDQLVAERVWQEMSRAMMHPRPSRFFRLLREFGALARLLPELDVLFGVPQVARWHPEIDTGDHVMRVLDVAAADERALAVRFAALVHDLGKGITPDDALPSHPGHETAGLPLVEAVCARLRVPSACRELGLLVCRHHLNVHRAATLRPATLVDLLQRVDAWRRPERFEQFLQACQADRQGRKGRVASPVPEIDLLRRAAVLTAEVDAAALAARGHRGPKLGAAIRDERIGRVRRLLGRR